MALRSCPDCNHQCSTNAEACPGCGNFFQDLRPMKRVQVERASWSTTIALGVVGGTIITMMISVIGVMFLLALIGQSLTPSLPINR